MSGKTQWWSHQCISFSIRQKNKATTYYVLRGFSLLLGNKSFEKNVCVSQRVCGTWMRTKWQSYFFVMQNLFLHSDFICYEKHTFYLREFNVKKTSDSLFRHICSASIYSSPWTLKSCIVLQLWITLDSFNFFTVLLMKISCLKNFFNVVQNCSTPNSETFKGEPAIITPWLTNSSWWGRRLKSKVILFYH